jgi:hypothetical protein
LSSNVYFWFELWFGVCLVEVVVVEAFFQHGCGTEPVGCGSFYGTCGMRGTKRKTK